MPTELARPVLETDRLIVALADRSHAPAALDYVTRNRAHFAPWDPAFPPERWTLAYWEARSASATDELRDDRSARFFAFPRADGERGPLIAMVNFTQMFRGPLNACVLGYSVDVEHEGKGYASEAVAACVRWAFDTWRVHRIVAGHMPQNLRSAKLLRGLGFAIEGYARDYLYVGGGWRDHVLTALLSPHTDPPGKEPG